MFLGTQVASLCTRAGVCELFYPHSLPVLTTKSDNRLRDADCQCMCVLKYHSSFASPRSNASHVTTVDVAEKALQYATANWALNGLKDSAHESGA